MSRHEDRFEGVKKSDKFDAPPEVFKIMKTPGHFLHDPTSPTTFQEWMVQSLDEHGQQQPVVAVEIDGELYIQAGRTRDLAMIELNKRRAKKGLPAMRLSYVLKDRRKVTDEMFARSKDVENIDRRHLNPIAIAHHIAEDAGRKLPPEYTAKRLAAAGVTVDDIPVYAAINACSPAIRDGIASGHIPWRTAPQLADVTHAEGEEAVAEATAEAGGKPLTVKQVKKAVKAVKEGKSKDKPPVIHLPSVKVVDALYEAFGPNEPVPARALLAFLKGERGVLSAKREEKLMAVMAEASKRGRKPAAKGDAEEEGGE